MVWMIIAGWYVVASVVTFCAYGLDKRAARKGTWRTKEATLHVLELIGGWPGALIGQGVFRHKTRKLSFKIVTWLIVVLHAAGWAGWLVWRAGLMG